MSYTSFYLERYNYYGQRILVIKISVDAYTKKLAEVDPELARAIRDETIRQNDNLQLIASESPASLAVLEATGSVMTNKYAEGYPGKRYYGGCEFVDVAEELAIERAKQLFGAEHVNVQPHSGTQANMAVYFAALEPGDAIMSMELSHGGHLSHGHKLNFSGKLYDIHFYQVSEENHTLDYAELSAMAKKVKPKMIVCGYSAYPRTIDFKAFREIADDVGAYLMADICHIAGLVAAGAHPSPVGHADFITTTTHKTLRGPRGAMIMCREEFAKDIDRTVFPGIQGGPFMHLIAGKAVAFKEALSSEWRDSQHQIVANAKVLASELLSHGFELSSGGTDNHLMLLDLREKQYTGKDAEFALNSSGVTVNKNTIPFDTRPPFVTSGIRVGTPYVTFRGMGEDEMKVIGSLITHVLEDPGDESVRDDVRRQAKELCQKFPLYKL